MSEIQKARQIGDMVFVKYRYPDRNDYWYDPLFVVRLTPAFVFAQELFGPTIRLSRRELERSGLTIHRTSRRVIYAEMPEEYKKQTVGYLMAEEPRKVLGLPADFTEQQLKDAYRAAVVMSHPDKGGKHEDFIKIQAAYDRLSNGGKSIAEIIKFAKAQNP